MRSTGRSEGEFAKPKNYPLVNASNANPEKIKNGRIKNSNIINVTIDCIHNKNPWEYFLYT